MSLPSRGSQIRGGQLSQHLMQYPVLTVSGEVLWWHKEGTGQINMDSQSSLNLGGRIKSADIFHLPQDPCPRFPYTLSHRLTSMDCLPSWFQLGLENWEYCRYQTDRGECSQELIPLRSAFCGLATCPLWRSWLLPGSPLHPVLSLIKGWAWGWGSAHPVILAWGSYAAHCVPLLQCPPLCR